MEIQYKCLICGESISSKNYAISRHVKKHNISLDNYIEKYYKTISSHEKCGFCDKKAVAKYEIDHIKLEYTLNYDKGFLCRTIECKSKISLDILGVEYEPKKFEKIGSKSEYLSKLYKTDINTAKSMKYSPKSDEKKFNNKLEDFQRIYGEIDGKYRYDKRLEGIIKNHAGNKFSCTLESFINKYGFEKGTISYNKRCERISYTSSIDFFIDKYGKEEGVKVWKNKFKQIKTSKSSLIIGNILDKLDIKYTIEYNINGKFVDYYLDDFNIVIEYFGNYWHMNPKLYSSNEYNSRIKKTASEIWIDDRNRLTKIKEICNSIIIIWESTKIDVSLLEKTINDIKNKKTIINL